MADLARISGLSTAMNPALFARGVVAPFTLYGNLEWLASWIPMATQERHTKTAVKTACHSEPNSAVTFRLPAA